MSDVLIYALLVLGSGSFGYAITRLALPEVRSWPMDYKMGASVVIGGGIALISIFIGMFFPSFLYFSLLGIGAVSIQVVKTKSALFTPSEIEVAVPKKYLEKRVAKEEKIPMNVLYKKLKERKPAAEAKIVRAAKPRKGITIPKVQLPFVGEPEVEVETPKVPEVTVSKRRAIEIPKEKTLKEAVAEKEEIPLVEKPKKKGLFSFLKKPKAPKPKKPRPERHKEEKKKEVPKPKKEKPKPEPKKHMTWREKRAARMGAVPMSSTPIAGAAPPPTKKERVRRGRRGRRERPGRAQAAPTMPAVSDEPLPDLGLGGEMPKIGGLEDTGMPKIGEISDLEAPAVDNELSVTDLDSGIGGSELPSIDDMATLDVLGADAGTQTVKTDEKKVCKTCNAPLKKAVFCSSCGTQFCPNCAEAVNVGENTTRYTCPKCKAKVVVQNK